MAVADDRGVQQVLEDLCQLSNDDMFLAVKEALMSNLDVAHAVVDYFKEFLSELPVSEEGAQVADSTASGGGLPVGKNGFTAGETAGPSDSLYWGIVTSKNFRKGATMLSCPAAEFETATVPAGAAPPAALPDGKCVAFVPKFTASGAAFACPPVWALAGQLHRGVPLPAGQHIGRVSGMLPSGIAFIDSPTAKAEFGRDPAAHSKVAEQCALQVGELIAFNTVTGSAGKVWMSAPCWKCCTPGVDSFPDPFVCLDPDKVPHTEMQPAKPHQPHQPHQPRQPQTQSMVSPEELYVCTVMTKQQVGCNLWCPALESEVWVDAAVVDPWYLNPNDGVACRVRGPRGRLQAIAPVWKRMGGAASEEDAVSFGPFFGEISGRSSPKGDAWFIVSEQIKAVFGRDAAVHATILTQCGLTVGDFLAFPAQQGHTGKVWLSAPCWKCCSNDSHMLADFVTTWVKRQESAADEGPPMKKMRKVAWNDL